jgi:hypothetical protein
MLHPLRQDATWQGPQATKYQVAIEVVYYRVLFIYRVEEGGKDQMHGAPVLSDRGPMSPRNNSCPNAGE